MAGLAKGTQNIDPLEKPLFNAVTIYRERGNYLQRLEQFEKAIQAYNEALRFNETIVSRQGQVVHAFYSLGDQRPPARKCDTKDGDVSSLLGRSLARAKATHYIGALQDAEKAAELEPETLSASEIRAQTEYEKCAFERSLVLAHRGQRMRRCPPKFAECARIAEETIRECVNTYAKKMMAIAVKMTHGLVIESEDVDEYAPVVIPHVSRMQNRQTPHSEEMNRVEKHKSRIISRLMASKYLERMAHDKYFLIALTKDERLMSANLNGARHLQELADKALADVIMRQEVLRERRPFYAARASEAAARDRLSESRKEQLERTQNQNIADAKRLIDMATKFYEQKDTAKCVENAEFGMERINRKPGSQLPGKEKYLQELQDIVANAFLNQNRVGEKMSEMDRENRAFALLGIALSREPSRDSVLKVRPPAPRRDAKRRLRVLELAFETSARPSERCYLLHELARLHIETKQSQKARFYAYKCQQEARTANQRIWLLNATFLLARAHVMSNNRPEARVALIEGQGLAKNYRMPEVAEFFDTCVNISMEGEVEAGDAALEQREKEMVNLMQDDDMRSEAEHLFRKMSVLPAARRFSVMPGTRHDSGSTSNATAATRRQSIAPRSQMPTKSPIKSKNKNPLGLQEFDI